MPSDTCHEPGIVLCSLRTMAEEKTPARKNGGKANGAGPAGAAADPGAGAQAPSAANTPAEAPPVPQESDLPPQLPPAQPPAAAPAVPAPAVPAPAAPPALQARAAAAAVPVHFQVWAHPRPRLGGEEGRPGGPLPHRSQVGARRGGRVCREGGQVGGEQGVGGRHRL